jgi:hypothetical protein
MPLTYDITNGMIFGLLSALCFYFTTGKIFKDIQNIRCSRRPEYTEILESDDQESQMLLLDTDVDEDVRQMSIEKAKKALNGSERTVPSNAILY